MSLISCQQFAAQNVTEVNSTLTDVPLCQSTAVITSEKLSDTGTGRKAHKILQYGSRHTIQNTGWTTRLSCDTSPRRHAVSSAKKLPLPRTSGKNLKPLFPRLPFISITKPTVLNLQSPPAVTGTAAGPRAVHMLGSTDNQCVGPVGLHSTSSIAQCTVTSGSMLQTILPQPYNSVSAVTGPSLLNHAVLTMPTVATHTGGKPPTVCFIPISSVICAPISGLPTDAHQMENMPVTFPLAPGPTSLVGVHRLNLEPLLTQSCAANGSKTVVTNATTKPLSSDFLSPKELFTCTPDGQASGVRMLNVKVHIDHGHITEVKELSQKQHEPKLTPGMIAVHLDAAVLTSTMVSGAAGASQTYLDHVDTNGAQFAYHDLTDGKRIRIARDTNGQRHAPFFLIPNDDESCSFEERTVELRTRTNVERQVVPEEADVSEVGTVFTYEPLYVSEQTLVPVPRKKTPYDSAVSLSEDESNYYYRCYLCSYLSDDHVKVCRHWVNVHLTELPYRCPYCDRTFFTSTKAQVHVNCQHKGNRLTTVGFQRSSYFVNTLSYEVGETDTDEDSDSDKGEEDEIVLEHSSLRPLPRTNSMFGCRKCRFKTRSLVEMRGHVKFVHGHNQLKLVQLHDTDQQKVQFSNKQSLGGSHLLRAEIAWSNISEKLVVNGECQYQCRWCAFQGKNVSVISLHVLQEHNWPAAVLCPYCSCNVLLTEVDRHSTTVTCFSCKAKILLLPSSDESPSPEAQGVVLVCNICAFKTRGRSHMCRHIKYNHTKCRPYTCVYCNYVADERAQVKLHIAHYHPNQSVIVKERSEANGQFRHVINNLFPKLVSVQTSEGAGLPLNADDGAKSDNSEPVPSADVDGLFFTCEECNLETSSLADLIRHQRRFHKSTLAANAAMIPTKPHDETAALPGEHFKCKICGYCCLDRSCMSRHVKYMHITVRPHSCMYCSYNNVEKTKVRLHVMAHHPGRQKTVLTDYKVLDEISRQAKHFYIRIDSKGQVVDDNSGIVNKTSASPLDRATASPDSSDSELSEDLLADEQSKHHDVHMNDDDSLLAKKEESMGVTDDDVDIDFYPRRNAVDASLNSVITVDHNYAQISAADNQTAAITAHHGSIVIKQEPLVFDYDDRESDQVHSEFGSKDARLNNDSLSEVKTEATDGFFSTAVDSLDLSGTSDSESDDLSDSEKSDNSEMFNGECSSDSELSFDTDEPLRKKVRVAFGVDPTAEDSTTLGSLIIDSDVWQDPKMHMTPVVELEDVLQIILAWQQNVGETDDIM